ncbi:hypothetical protein BVRB_9g224930 [Beta vulgaris subsp. vulgaris]|uniref:RNase H type-1 domain-containing protein n=1 Tax=Beta vulgaris subsp. vulgaris TaxID=3555 RepID=A0A0J8B5C6_BETVV|nr:hypothetical protein BVRB_9g224930 [Beta vulgaris subsp. vulgaris]
MRHHAIFVQQVHDPTRNPLDPSAPPGFVIANIGHQNGHPPSIIIQIAGTRPNKKGLGGIAWVMGFTNCLPSAKHGTLSYSPSTGSTEAMACLHAITWATSHQYSQIQILTKSRQLVQLLQPGNHTDITLNWTVQKILAQARNFLTCQILYVAKEQVAEATRLAHKWQQFSMGRL